MAVDHVIESDLEGGAERIVELEAHDRQPVIGRVAGRLIGEHRVVHAGADRSREWPEIGEVALESQRRRQQSGFANIQAVKVGAGIGAAVGDSGSGRMATRDATDQFGSTISARRRICYGFHMLTAGRLAGIDTSAAYAGTADSANVGTVAARLTFPIIASAPFRLLFVGFIAGEFMRGQTGWVEAGLRQYGLP